MASSSSTSIMSPLEAGGSAGGVWYRKSAPPVLLRPSRLCPTVGAVVGFHQQGMDPGPQSQPRPRPKSLGSEAEKRTAEGLMALFGMGPYGRLMRPAMNNQLRSLPVGPAVGGDPQRNQNQNGLLPLPLQNRSNSLAAAATGPSSPPLSFDQENRDSFQNYKQNVEAELRMRDGAIKSLRETVEACQAKMLEMKLEKDAYAARESQVFQEIQQDVLNLLHRVNSFVEREGLPQYSNPPSGFPGLSKLGSVNGQESGTAALVLMDNLLDKLNNVEERMVNMERNNEVLLATCKSTEDTFKNYMMQTSDKLDQLANCFMAAKYGMVVSDPAPGPGPSSAFEDFNSSQQPSVPNSPAQSISSESPEDVKFIVPNHQYEEAPLHNLLEPQGEEFEGEEDNILQQKELGQVEENVLDHGDGDAAVDETLEKEEGSDEAEDNILDQEGRGEAEDNIFLVQEEANNNGNVEEMWKEQEAEYNIQEDMEHDDFLAKVEIKGEQPGSIEVGAMSPLPVEVILHSEPSPARSSHSSKINLEDGDHLRDLDEASNNPHHHKDEVNEHQEQIETEDVKKILEKRMRLTMDSSAESEQESSLEDGECSDSDDDNDSLPPMLSLPSRIVKDPKRRLQTMPILLPESIPLGPRPVFGSHIVGENGGKEVSFRQIVMEQRKKIKPRRNLSSEFKENIPPRPMKKLFTHAAGNVGELMASEGARRVVVGIRTEKESSTIGLRHARDFSKPGYACLCGSKFTGAGGLYVHQVKQMEHEKFSCSQCGKRFHYFSGLKAHRKATHKMEFSSQVGCSRCGQVFDSKKKRQGHRDARGQTCWLSGSYQSKNWELIRNKRVRHPSFGGSSMNILKNAKVAIPK